MRLRVWFVAGVAVAGLVLAGIAGGDAVSRRFAGGVVALTNSQANSS